MARFALLATLLLIACDPVGLPEADQALNADAPTQALNENSGPNGTTAVLQIKGCGQGTCRLDGSRSFAGPGAELTGYRWVFQRDERPWGLDTVFTGLEPTTERTYTASGYWTVILAVFDDQGFGDADVEWARVNVRN